MSEAKETPPPDQNPRRRMTVQQKACICLFSGRKRMGNPQCPVTFHNDQIDDVFEEFGIMTDVLDNGIPPNLKEDNPNV